MRIRQGGQVGTRARRLLVTALACWAALAALAAGAGAGAQRRLAGASGQGGLGGDASAAAATLLGRPLDPPALQLLDGGEQEALARLARYHSPQAVQARDLSRTAYAGLAGAQAASLARRSFPMQVEQQAGGLPPLPSGARVLGYPTISSARVQLPGGGRAVVESLAPLLTESAPGRALPIDLSLQRTAGGFEPVRSSSSVLIPTSSRDGAQLTDVGLSMAPADAAGAPVSVGGAPLGAGVFYADTATDTDTLVKPTDAGFEEDSVLRSAASPQQLRFRLGLPAGARLVAVEDEPGALDLVAGGRTLASISAPRALDAAGADVPVSMTLTGDRLTLSVPHRSGSYQYPILVDPTVTDHTTLLAHPGETGNWAFYTPYSSTFSASEGCSPHCAGTIGIRSGERTAVARGEWAALSYPTQGQSRIYQFSPAIEISEYEPKLERTISIRSSAGAVEGGASMVVPNPEDYYGDNLHEYTICVQSGCSIPSVGDGPSNSAVVEVFVPNNGTLLYGQMTHLVSAPNIPEGLTYVAITQTSSPSAASLDTSEATIDGHPNALYPGTWTSTDASSATAVGLYTRDPGIGIDAESLTSPGDPGWSTHQGREAQNGCAGVQCNECYQAPCAAGESGTGSPLDVLFADGNGTLPEGEDTIQASGEDAVGLKSTTAAATIKVDNTPPGDFKVTGLPDESGEFEIASKPYVIKTEASDGTTIASSGVRSLVLAIDGKPLGEARGSCAPGPCTASAEWSIDGVAYAGGEHTLTLTATDNAGNVSSQSYPLRVDHKASREAIGPGAVDPESGEFSLQATDVSQAFGLKVERSYDSRHLLEGAEGPLGPQWTLSLGEVESLAPQPSGSVVLTQANGEQAIFASNGQGGFDPPEGDANLSLTAVQSNGSVSEYLLSDAASATTTRFTLPSGGGSTWVPTVQEGVAPSDTVTYEYQTVEVAGRKITRPLEALAPVPTGVSCAPELQRGCRALTFNYASSTTASGEGPAQWGDYEGRLTRVYLTSWDPATKAMATTTVAQYAYDTLGRLRAEWDPRVSPALKTEYGYDAEGHVTALTPPGQESWAFTYGTITGDDSSGRLLKVTLAPASAPLWDGEAPKNTSAPALSGDAGGGARMSVSNGAWSNSPVVYGYQWEDCNAEHQDCTPIAGASNASYTVANSDVGHTLLARVSATNGAGTTSVTVGSAVVTQYPAVFQSAVAVHGFRTIRGPEGDFWSSESASDRETIRAYNEKGEVIKQMGEERSNWSEPDIKAIGVAPSGDVWVALNSQVQEFNPQGQVVRLVSLDAGSLAVDSHGDVWLTSGTSVLEYSEGWTLLRSWDKEGQTPEALHDPCAIGIAPDGDVWVADRPVAGGELKEFTEGGAFIRRIVSAEYGEQPQLAFPGGEPITLGFDARGDVYVPTDYEEGEVQIQVFTETGEYLTWFGSAGGGSSAMRSPSGAFPEADGNVWVMDKGNQRVEKWTMPAVIDGEATAPQPGSTIEYDVPVSKGGIFSHVVPPYQMGAKEVEAWGQADAPVEATAIFPPDEPQTWPAGDYRRATIYYADSRGRIVNVITPGGGVATSEYNATNDLVRTLSPDDRAAALQEGSKSAEASKRLDTESAYNAEGTELLSTLGPEHTIKLASGAEAQARRLTTYSYDEGAPSQGGPYRLVTKVVQSAQLATGEQVEARETTTSYSGQEGLGWKLRKPTATTTDPHGLDLVRKTVYDPSSGNVIETTTPAGSNPHPLNLLYATELTSSAGVTLGRPADVQIDGQGDLWVIDQSYDRIDEFSPQGTYVKSIGGEGSGDGELDEPEALALDKSGDVWVADTGNDRIEEFSAEGKFLRAVGKEGSAAGQFTTPEGIAVDSKGDVWVSDTENGRIQEFKKNGKYLKSIGTTGSETETLGEPEGLVFDAGGDLWVADYANDKVDEFSAAGKYLQGFTTTTAQTGGRTYSPFGIALSANGDVLVTNNREKRVEIYSQSGEFKGSLGSEGSGAGQLELGIGDGLAVDPSGDVWVADAKNKRLEEWKAGAGNPQAANTQLVYYSSEANPTTPACGEHPEWANLLCVSQPVEQPETPGLEAGLAITTASWNMWDEPATVTERFPNVTRTEHSSYDAAGRLIGSEVSAKPKQGTALPSVSYAYSPTTGALVKQSAGGHTLTSEYDTRGELKSYTDAAANTATYSYDVDGRLEAMADGRGSQTYHYDETTGELTSMIDSAAGAFTASYDAEGRQTSEGLPNGMLATRVYNAAGEASSIAYVKTSDCSSACTWLSDSVVPSIHGQWLSQTSTLSSQRYAYDAAGRLTEVQQTPAGQGCTTRIYGYDEETNRTSLTTREAPAGAGCASEGGADETHAYDSANRLIDKGVAYDEFGNTTALPAGDAGGSELTSSYYVDDLLASQTQAGETLGYKLDPAGRALETVATGTKASAVVSHYDDPGQQPAWTEGSSGEWTREITGIDGELVAVQNDGEAPVLQLANLHHDVIATAYLSSTATALAAKADTSEYGVPTVSLPPKYSWLGADEIPTELPSGVLAMGVRSYVPQLGRFLQPDPVPGGSANAYAYTFGDPVNASDLSGAYTASFGEGLIETLGREASEEAARLTAEEIAREEAARAEAEALARAAAEAQGFGAEEWWEEWEEWEEGEWYEWAAYQHGAAPHGEGAQAQPAVLSEPLGEVAGADLPGVEGQSPSGSAAQGAAVQLCRPGSEGPCASEARAVCNDHGKCHGGGGGRSRGGPGQAICDGAEAGKNLAGAATGKDFGGSMCGPDNPNPNEAGSRAGEGGDEGSGAGEGEGDGGGAGEGAGGCCGHRIE